MEMRPWHRHYDYNVPTTIRYSRIAAQEFSATDREIIDFCKAKLIKYKVPTVVEFREGLPKSVVGKILRKILREEEMEKREKSKGGKS